METPAGLEDEFVHPSGLNLTHANFMNFITFFSLPNIPGSFVGGYIVNWLTHQKGTVVFMVMAVAGQLLGAFGCLLISEWMIFVGRAVFGLAIEIANICVFSYIVQWFAGEWYNFSFGFSVALARLGTTLIMMVGPVMFEQNLEAPFGYYYLDNTTDQMSARQFAKYSRNYSSAIASPSTDLNRTDFDCTFNPCVRMPVQEKSYNLFILYLITTILLVITTIGVIVLLFFKPPVDEDEELVLETIADSKTVSITGIKLAGRKCWVVVKKTVKQCKFNSGTWLVIATCLLFYGTIEPWVIQAKTFFEHYHGINSTERSALLSSLLSLVPIVGCPLAGILIDRVKCNAWWCLGGSTISLLGHILFLTFSPTTVGGETDYNVLIVANLLLGIGYSMFASAIWTLLSYTVSKRECNIAYGMIQSMQHIGFIFSSSISGAIVQNFQAKQAERRGYFYSEWFFVMLTVASMLTIILFIVVHGSGSKKNLSENRYKKVEE